MNNFRLGTASKIHLSETTGNMQLVVNTAIILTDVDFSVVDAERSRQEQIKNIANGVSWTMDSDHIHTDEQEDHAVDIYPWIPFLGTSFHPDHYARVAKAMFAAGFLVDVEVEWGGFWVGKHYDPAHWSEVI